MDLATIQQLLQAMDAQQQHPFRSGAECVTAMTEELGEIATEVSLLERIGTKAGWAKEPSSERLTTELVHLLVTLVALANRYQIDLDSAYAAYIGRANRRRRPTRPTPPQPLVRKVDAIQIRVPDLDAGLAFYRDRLGHQLVWRTEQAVGLRLPDSDTELVLQTERDGPEINLLVESADQAAQRVVNAGGAIVVPPFDIQIGRCVVVRDPWGTTLVLLDTSKGLLVADAEGNVIGIRPA